MNRIQAAQLQRNRESLSDIDALSSKLMEALETNDELRSKLSDVEDRSDLKAKEDAAATSAATAKLVAAQRQLAGMQSAVAALTKRNESLEKDLERVTADYAADRELWKSFKEWWTGVVATNMAKQGAKKPRVDERGKEILRQVGLDTPELMEKRPSSSGSVASTTSAGGTSTTMSRRRSHDKEATSSKPAAPRESTPKQPTSRESASKQSELRESASKQKEVRYSASRPNAALSTSRPAAASPAVAVTPTPKPRGVSANVAATPSALRNSVVPSSPVPRPITKEALKQARAASGEDAGKGSVDNSEARLNDWIQAFGRGPAAIAATSINGGHAVVTDAGPSKPREPAAAAAAARKERPSPNGGPMPARPREALATISQPNSQEEVVSSSATAAAPHRHPRAPLPRRTQGGSEGAWQRCASSSQEMLSSAARRNSSTTPGLSQICSIKAESDDEADREVAVCRVPTRRRFEGPNDDDYIADEPQQRGGSRPARSRAEEEKEQEELLRRRRRAELDEMNRDPEGYRRRRAAALGLERYAAAGRGNGTSNSRGNISAHYEIDPALNGGEAHEHVAVVRDKATRKRMHAHDCPCCKDYWDVTEQAEAAMTRERGETEDAGSSSRLGVAAAAAAAKKRPRRSEPAGISRATSGEAVFEQMRALGAGTTSNGSRTADGNAEEEGHEQDRLHNERLQKAGRHRAWGRPPATPEGYWDLGFPSTSRQNAINEAADRQRDAMWEQIQHDPRYKRRKRG